MSCWVSDPSGYRAGYHGLDDDNDKHDPGIPVIAGVPDAQRPSSLRRRRFQGGRDVEAEGSSAVVVGWVCNAVEGER